jgi:dTDP-4-amino-4,6-dideoxygalactose transaminase
MFIPFVDLKAQYNLLKNEIDSAIQSVVDETAFIRGKYVEEFENNFAAELGVKHCIGVANGTDAIYIILKMLNIKEGDEVITVANSWISTSETISQTGARPIFVDIEPDYFTINPDLIEQAINPRTKAIIPVHLYGQPADMNKILSLCDKYKLYLIEDCAQAHFVEYEGRKVGTFGIASSFSFYPGKNLGAYGDAGAIITNNDDLANKMRMYSNHGALVKHNHLIEGINSRLDGLQASVLNVKLKYIYQWNQERLDNALFYNELLKNLIEIKTPVIRNNSKHIFHIYCIRTEKRDELKKYLADNGIESAIHYPVALPNMPAYRYLNYKPTDFPISSDYQSRILSLPMYPELSNQQIRNVVDVIKRFYNYS